MPFDLVFPGGWSEETTSYDLVAPGGFTSESSADRYVKASGSNNNDGLSWDTAWATIKYATDRALPFQTIYVDNALTDVIVVPTTYTLATGVRVISTSDTVNLPPTTYATGAAVDGSATFGVDIGLVGKGSWLGVTFKSGSTGTSTMDISTVTGVLTFEDCLFWCPSTTASALNMNNPGLTNHYGRVITRNCSYRWGNVANAMTVGGYWESYGDDFCSAGSVVPNTLFASGNFTTNPNIHIEGADLGDIVGTLFSAFSTTPTVEIVIINSKVAAATVVSFTGSGSGSLWLINCDSGDDHYKFAHYDYFGSTVMSVAIYAAGGAMYDGTNGISWQVTSSANASVDRPYVSPWIPVYHSGTSAITPSLEVVRSGSATAYKDNEIWSEWAYKGTSGSTRTTLVDDKCGNLATPANQATGSLGAADWTGESGTSWFGKLTPTAAITPAELGKLMVRVKVGKASVTDLYVDPFIRTLT